MKRLRHPWIAAMILVLVIVVVGATILIVRGYQGIRERGSWRRSEATTLHVASHNHSISEEIRARFDEMGMGDAPDNVMATISSLQKIDDYPIYTMRYYGPYIRVSDFTEQYGLNLESQTEDAPIDWGCSLFGAVGDPDWPVMGRNFDWEYSPILVLFLEPEEGYQSVMSIDLAYLVSEDIVGSLDECSVEQLLPLLSAPFLTFDGMNEAGLAIGMASVDYECGYPTDPDKRDVGDLRIMREVLEAAATVDEALEFLEGINPVSQGGPNTHYLIADTTPSAALIEYHDGEMCIFRSTEAEPWQVGTNFPVVLTDGNPEGNCWRYDAIAQSLTDQDGDLSSLDALNLLEQVSTPMTQWSIAYDLAKRIMYLVVARDFDTKYAASLETGRVIQQRDSGPRH
ncbi:linear amide C-N hydrolase [Candidatus Bipolaricaulota bacterium]